jgi:hypothetical protein
MSMVQLLVLVLVLVRQLEACLIIFMQDAAALQDALLSFNSPVP